jgi:DNA polymerase III delta prime subunit
MDADLKRITELFDLGHLAPCWLIHGDPIKTRTFADQLIHYVFTSPVNGHGMRAELVERHIKNGSFGNLILLQKIDDASEIVIDQLMPITDFLNKSPLIPGWRIILVDQVTDLNRFCANSLLKSLEEPPQRTLFLLLCQSLGTLLPTIRSRCQILSLIDKNEVTSELPYRTEATELLHLASQGNFSRIQQICDRVISGNKAVYDTLATTLFDVIYKDALTAKNGESAELWLTLTRFWADAKTTHLDKQHAFLMMLASANNTSYLQAELV